MKTLFLLSIFTIILISGYSQDTLTLMNGKQIHIKEFSYVEDDTLQINILLKNGKSKSYDKDEIYTIIKANAMPIYFYPTTNKGVNLTDNELKMYIGGMTDAYNNYKAPYDFLSAYFLGFGSPFITRSFLNPLIPLTYSFTIGMSLPTSKNYARRHLCGMDENYQKGFVEVRRKKRLRNNLAGGALGLISGLLVIHFVGE